MKFKIGDKVRFTNEEWHNTFPKLFPPIGTVGYITDIFYHYGIAYVQWTKGSTSNDDEWGAYLKDLELIEEETYET